MTTSTFSRGWLPLLSAVLLLPATAAAESPPLDWYDVQDTSDYGAGVDTGPPEAEPGSMFWPCGAHSDCNSELCVLAGTERVCTEYCVEACPVDWACVLVEPEMLAPDVAFVCLPMGSGPGAPCVDHGECGANYCAETDYAPVCSAVCDEDPCVAGWTCELLSSLVEGPEPGEGGKVCAPSPEEPEPPITPSEPTTPAESVPPAEPMPPAEPPPSAGPEAPPEVAEPGPAPADTDTDAVTDAAPAADSGGQRSDSGGGGCAAAPRAGWGGVAWLLLLTFLVARRRYASGQAA